MSGARSFLLVSMLLIAGLLAGCAADLGQVP
jgi:hypothetical protein